MSATERSCNSFGFLLRLWMFDRWILVCADDHALAWSGMRWVPINGPVAISNFDTREEAAAYGLAAGLYLADNQIS
jgi:hypothetical protein